VLCALRVVFPSSLPGGMIVLEGFVGKLFKYEPRSTQEEVEGISNPKNGFVAGWNYIGLSGHDSWKEHTENEGIEGNAQAIESNKYRD
jgi:hypothetical protein